MCTGCIFQMYVLIRALSCRRVLFMFLSVPIKWGTGGDISEQNLTFDRRDAVSTELLRLSWFGYSEKQNFRHIEQD